MAIFAFCAYVFAAITCAQLFSAIGERNPQTIDDSWTGDTALDGWSLILWPAALLILAAILIGKRLAKAMVR